MVARILSGELCRLAGDDQSERHGQQQPDPDLVSLHHFRLHFCSCGLGFSVPEKSVPNLVDGGEAAACDLAATGRFVSRENSVPGQVRYVRLQAARRCSENRVELAIQLVETVPEPPGQVRLP